MLEYLQHLHPENLLMAPSSVAQKMDKQADKQVGAVSRPARPSAGVRSHAGQVMAKQQQGTARHRTENPEKLCFCPKCRRINESCDLQFQRSTTREPSFSFQSRNRKW